MGGRGRKKKKKNGGGGGGGGRTRVAIQAFELVTPRYLIFLTFF